MFCEVKMGLRKWTALSNIGLLSWQTFLSWQSTSECWLWTEDLPETHLSQFHSFDRSTYCHWIFQENLRFCMSPDCLQQWLVRLLCIPVHQVTLCHWSQGLSSSIPLPIPDQNTWNLVLCTKEQVASGQHMNSCVEVGLQVWDTWPVFLIFFPWPQWFHNFKWILIKYQA